MKFKTLYLLLFVFLFRFAHPALPESRNLLSGSYTLQQVDTLIVPMPGYHPYPTINDRNAWQDLPEPARKSMINNAEALLGCDWPLSTATLLLNYSRNGNRSIQEAVHFQRREQLGRLVLGECVENQGRFLDDIANGIWAICEETYWGLPAHLGLQKRGSGLPDVTEPTVDLFAAETGALLSWTHYLLAGKLDTVSPLLDERLLLEIKRRITDVCLERSDFWWMGLDRSRIVNNWNPWICSNWLTCVLLTESDPTRRTESVYKIMRCLDEFTNPYPADGGCDEGPSYWGRAGASLFDCLNLLYHASNGQIDIFDDPLIGNIGKYIYRIYIDHDYFVNFADASAINRLQGFECWRYGQAIHSETMSGFGAFEFQKSWDSEKGITFDGRDLGRSLGALFNLGSLLATGADFSPERDAWFPELQVMAARSKAGSSKGLYLAAKGGHNDESHNHNDVGNFIVYADGYPAIIDVGVETYTEKTFSSRRYEIWTMQSAYHNLPTINGIMQSPGREFKARDVEYKATDRSAGMRLELAGAWPEAAGVESWQRDLDLKRGKSITITDEYKLAMAAVPLQWTLMSWAEPISDRDGVITLRLADRTGGAARNVNITYDPEQLGYVVEPIAIQDDRLERVWQDKVYRIRFTAKTTTMQGKVKMVISL